MKRDFVTASSTFGYVCSGLEVATSPETYSSGVPALLGHRIDAAMRANFAHEREIGMVAA